MENIHRNLISRRITSLFPAARTTSAKPARVSVSSSRKRRQPYQRRISHKSLEFPAFLKEKEQLRNNLLQGKDYNSNTNSSLPLVTSPGRHWSPLKSSCPPSQLASSKPDHVPEIGSGLFPDDQSIPSSIPPELLSLPPKGQLILNKFSPELLPPPPTQPLFTTLWCVDSLWAKKSRRPSGATEFYFRVNTASLQEVLQKPARYTSDGMGRPRFEWVVPEKLIDSIGKGIFGKQGREVMPFTLSEVSDKHIQSEFGSNLSKAIFDARTLCEPGMDMIMMEVSRGGKATLALYLTLPQVTACLELRIDNE